MTKHEEIDLIMNSDSLDSLIGNENKLILLDNWDRIALKKIWLRNHDFTLDDYVNRKRELNSGVVIRKHNYAQLKQYREIRNHDINKQAEGHREKWTEAEIVEFLTITSIFSDLEIAGYFKRTVNSIAGQRRKLSLIRMILKNREIAVKEVIALMLQSEQTLKKELEAVG